MEAANVILSLKGFCAKIVNLVTVDRCVNTVMRQRTSPAVGSVFVSKEKIIKQM